jgi:hypothetical protein
MIGREILIVLEHKIFAPLNRARAHNFRRKNGDEGGAVFECWPPSAARASELQASPRQPR